MIGCWVAWKCLVACLLGESSQQPTWPQARQIRKCSQSLPVLRHSSQPSALGVTSRMPARWVQCFTISLVSRVARSERGLGGVAEKGMQRRHHLGALADRAADALDRTRAHVADREYAGHR